MQQADGLVLRDIHASVAPAWWPPAPGWWWLLALVLAGMAALAGWRLARRRRRRRVEAFFDGCVDTAATAAAQVGEISTLLRRAARRVDPGSATLHGPAWTAFVAARAGSVGGLDPVLQALLLEGGYRRAVDVDADAVRRLRPLARRLFVEWMLAR